jgi:hypothetical protein
MILSPFSAAAVLHVPATILRQVPLSGLVVWQHSLNQSVEAVIVVWMDQMNKLVGDEVLNQSRRQARHAPVEVEDAGTATGTPSVGEIAHDDGSWLSANPGSQQGGAALDPGLPVHGVPGAEVLLGAFDLVATELE